MCTEHGPTCPYNLDGDGSEYPCSHHLTTPLDPIETSGLSTMTLAQTFRHSGWARQRSKVYEALCKTEQTWSRREAFRTCGSTCFVLRSKSDPTRYKIAASGCHDRFCLPCAQTRSRIIAGNVAERIQRTVCRFVTLTLKHTDNPLTTDIERLYDGFKKLRKHKLWKATQRGGVAFLEIKRSRDGKSWHPHFHVLTTGKYIDGAKLGRVWHAITGDSYIVDVRSVPNPEAAIQYVTKYASKPFHPSLFENQTILQEAVLALQGRRMAISFGNFKGLQMTDNMSEDAWEFLDELESLARRAASGDLAAEKIIRAACGERAEEVLRCAAKQVVPRMNIGHPQVPIPYDYLQQNLSLN
jgi:hypothetical protein